MIRKSFEVEYQDEDDAEVFLDALDKRNLLSHTYEEETAEEAERLIKYDYVPMLRRLFATLKRKQAE
ncbi:MAG: nucleotidyltransferase substrate binding protein [Verrucomicrobia bacterium]|nr:nucleotidyltransferase substrate binding protein [Verrucomicrobiota bacterium]MCF7708168.1 nucleotidyltransferase substrate binding protein [Verrucomicrobiota bacterium]